MEVEATMWAEVFSVVVAWLTVVGLLIARVPKPPSLLEDYPVEAESGE
jgi:hypothetical protein